MTFLSFQWFGRLGRQRVSNTMPPGVCTWSGYFLSGSDSPPDHHFELVPATAWDGDGNHLCRRCRRSALSATGLSPFLTRRTQLRQRPKLPAGSRFLIENFTSNTGDLHRCAAIAELPDDRSSGRWRSSSSATGPKTKASSPDGAAIGGRCRRPLTTPVATRESGSGEEFPAISRDAAPFWLLLAGQRLRQSVRLQL